VLTVPVWREAMALYRLTRPAWTIWVVPGLVLAALLLLVAFSPRLASSGPWSVNGGSRPC
jgi:hypothetical protein